MTTEAIKYGAKQAIENCLNVVKGERVVLVTDKDTEWLANSLYEHAKGIGAEVQKFIMEDYGNRPDDGNDPIKFPQEIGKSLENAQVSVYIAQGKKGELQSFRIPMIKLVEQNKLRHAHMPNFIEDMMSQGMAADYKVIQEISAKVYDVVKACNEIKVTTTAGTNLTAKFDNNNYKWFICDGNIKMGEWTNLPDGEVFTCPIDANGKVVVDGCLGDFFNKKYGDLSNTPLSYELQNSRAVKGSVECSNPELKKEFEEYTFNTDENSNRLGEFAIGTNINLKKLISNLLQDEKFPGIHLALGSPYPDKTGAKWDSKAHNDGVMKNVTIEVDGKKIMEDSKFLI